MKESAFNSGRFVKGCKCNVSALEKARLAWKGNHHSEETKQKIKNALLGGKRAKGTLCCHWKGGKIKTSFGYVVVYNTEHPNRPGKREYVREHRLIMEKHIGRVLLPTEVVHHINGIKDDNRIENLQLLNNLGEHRKMHASTHCKRGHVFDLKNSYKRRDGTGRMCRKCCKMRKKRAILLKKELLQKGASK